MPLHKVVMPHKGPSPAATRPVLILSLGRKLDAYPRHPSLKHYRCDPKREMFNMHHPITQVDWFQTFVFQVKQMKAACGSAHMKSILAIGELGSMMNVYKASLVCMMAGSDFIKTSTGKEGVNATLAVGLVMCRYRKTLFTICE